MELQEVCVWGLLQKSHKEPLVNLEYNFLGSLRGALGRGGWGLGPPRVLRLLAGHWTIEVWNPFPSSVAGLNFSEGSCL